MESSDQITSRGWWICTRSSKSGLFLHDSWVICWSIRFIVIIWTRNHVVGDLKTNEFVLLLVSLPNNVHDKARYCDHQYNKHCRILCRFARLYICLFLIHLKKKYSYPISCNNQNCADIYTLNMKIINFVIISLVTYMWF